MVHVQILPVLSSGPGLCSSPQLWEGGVDVSVTTSAG